MNFIIFFAAMCIFCVNADGYGGYSKPSYHQNMEETKSDYHASVPSYQTSSTYGESKPSYSASVPSYNTPSSYQKPSSMPSYSASVPSYQKPESMPT